MFEVLLGGVEGEEEDAEVEEAASLWPKVVFDGKEKWSTCCCWVGSEVVSRLASEMMDEAEESVGAGADEELPPLLLILLPGCWLPTLDPSPDDRNPEELDPKL